MTHFILKEISILLLYGNLENLFTMTASCLHIDIGFTLAFSNPWFTRRCRNGIFHILEMKFCTDPQQLDKSSLCV